MNCGKQSWYRWIYLSAGTVAMTFCGFAYAWAVLKVPLAETFGWTPAELAFNHTLSMVFIAAGNLLAGRLARKVTSRTLIRGSAVLIFAGFCISSGMRGNILVLYASNAGLCGLGIGIFVVTIINVMGKWFGDRKGFCTSTLQMGLGFGGMVIGCMVSFLTGTLELGWRYTYFILGAVSGSLMMAASIIIREPSGELQMKMKGNIRQDACGKEQEPKIAYTTAQMLRQKAFYQFYMMNLTVSAVGTVMMNFTNDFFLSLGCTAGMAVLMVGCVSVGNGLGRFLIGIIYDCRGRRTTMMLTAGAALLGSGLLLAGAVTKNVYPGALGAVLAGVSYGFVPAAAGPIIRETYGEMYFASNYSVMLTNTMPASVMATLAGWILTGGGSFTVIFLILTLLSSGACVFFLTLNEERAWH